jgi:hypothetical protein
MQWKPWQAPLQATHLLRLQLDLRRLRRILKALELVRQALRLLLDTPRRQSKKSTPYRSPACGRFSDRHAVLPAGGRHARACAASLPPPPTGWSSFPFRCTTSRSG